MTKEAYLKCVGTGINKYPSNVTVGKNDVNGYNFVLFNVEYKNYLYYVSVVSEKKFEVETIYVSTLKDEV